MEAYVSFFRFSFVNFPSRFRSFPALFQQNRLLEYMVFVIVVVVVLVSGS